jgi:hypothetical protein
MAADWGCVGQTHLRDFNVTQFRKSSRSTGRTKTASKAAGVLLLHAAPFNSMIPYKTDEVAQIKSQKPGSSTL